MKARAAFAGDTLDISAGRKADFAKPPPPWKKPTCTTRESCRCSQRLSAREQDRVFELHGKRHCRTWRRASLKPHLPFLASHSSWIPALRASVATACARRCNATRRSASRRASAEQRKGRCGREAEGICIRLYSEEDYLASRQDPTPPEVLRTNLASVILRMAVLGFGEPGRVQVPPIRRDTRLVNDGVRCCRN